MHERIKEIAEQAGELAIFEDFDECMISETEEGLTLQVPAAFIKHFANLLIKECTRVPFDMWDKAELNADIAVQIENRINNHFGIE